MNYQYLMAGLGNPGSKYDGTRHNLGFAFIDYFIEHCSKHGQAEELSGAKFKCELWRVKETMDSPWWLLAKPLTFMNLSGLSICPLLSWHKLDSKSLIVVHDELDIAIGLMRFKFGGGNAGHNGLKSITEQLGGPNFYRLRLGIGRPVTQEENDISKYVLTKPSQEDRQRHTNSFSDALKVVHTFTNDGLERATKYALSIK